jgi:hypothetical protein
VWFHLTCHDPERSPSPSEKVTTSGRSEESTHAAVPDVALADGDEVVTGPALRAGVQPHSTMLAAMKIPSTPHAPSLMRQWWTWKDLFTAFPSVRTVYGEAARVVGRVPMFVCLIEQHPMRLSASDRLAPRAKIAAGGASFGAPDIRKSGVAHAELITHFCRIGRLEAVQTRRVAPCICQRPPLRSTSV